MIPPRSRVGAATLRIPMRHAAWAEAQRVLRRLVEYWIDMTEIVRCCGTAQGSELLRGAGSMSHYCTAPSRSSAYEGFEATAERVVTTILLSVSGRRRTAWPPLEAAKQLIGRCQPVLGQ